MSIKKGTGRIGAVTGRVGMMLAGSALCVHMAQAAAPADQYTVTVDTVTDNKTLLTWRRAPSPTVLAWSNAQAYCINGWRLPQIQEIHSLVDFQASNPAVDHSAFPTTASAAFWSSSPVVSTPGSNWGVDFSYGYDTFLVTQSATAWVRCVR